MSPPGSKKLGPRHRVAVISMLSSSLLGDNSTTPKRYPPQIKSPIKPYIVLISSSNPAGVPLRGGWYYNPILWDLLSENYPGLLTMSHPAKS